MKKVQVIISFSFALMFIVNVRVFAGQDSPNFKSENRLILSGLKAGQGSEESASRVVVCPSPIEGSKNSVLSTPGAGYQMRFMSKPTGEMGFDSTCPGSEYIFKGKIYMWGQIFDSDSNYPLTFKLDKDVGFVYLCGRGTVTLENGTMVHLGYNQKVDDWMAFLKDTDKLKRQGGTQAIGWLASTAEEKAKAIPALIALLNDSVIEVRRDSAEALGRIGDFSAKEALNAALKDNNEWVRKVIDESLALLDIRGTPKSEILLDKLKHESALVRSIAAEEIGRLKDKQALSALQVALQKEEEDDVKKTIEKAIQILQK